MNAEPDLAANDIVALSADFLPDPIFFSYRLPLVFKDEIARIDLKVVHPRNNFLVSLALSGGVVFAAIWTFSIDTDLLRSNQFFAIRREIWTPIRVLNGVILIWFLKHLVLSQRFKPIVFSESDTFIGYHVVEAVYAWTVSVGILVLKALRWAGHRVKKGGGREAYVWHLLRRRRIVHLLGHGALLVHSHSFERRKDLWVICIHTMMREDWRWWTYCRIDTLERWNFLESRRHCLLRVKGRQVWVTHRASWIFHLHVEHQLIRDLMSELLNKLGWHRLICSRIVLAGRSRFISFLARGILKIHLLFFHLVLVVRRLSLNLDWGVVVVMISS